MKCKHYNKLIMLYFDGALKNDDQEKLYQHINECPKCKALFNDLQGIMSALENTVMIEAPAGLENAVMNRIHSLQDDNIKTLNNPVMVLLGSMSLAALFTIFAAIPGLYENGIQGIIQPAASAINSFLENLWNIQVILNLISTLFYHSINSAIISVQGFYIISGFLLAAAALKKLMPALFSYQKNKI